MQVRPTFVQLRAASASWAGPTPRQYITGEDSFGTAASLSFVNCVLVSLPLTLPLPPQTPCKLLRCSDSIDRPGNSSSAKYHVICHLITCLGLTCLSRRPVRRTTICRLTCLSAYDVAVRSGVLVQFVPGSALLARARAILFAWSTSPDSPSRSVRALLHRVVVFYTFDLTHRCCMMLCMLLRPSWYTCKLCCTSLCTPCGQRDRPDTS